MHVERTDTLLSESPRSNRSNVQKKHLIILKIFMGTFCGVGLGAALGWVSGFGIGYGYNELLKRKLPGYVNDPEMANLMAKIAMYTGAVFMSIVALPKSALHSFDDKLSWRQFLIKALF